MAHKTCSWSQEYSSLAFSSDGKLIVGQGGAPEWNLTMWFWEKGKQACVTKPAPNQQPMPVYQARVRHRLTRGQGLV